MPTTVTIAGQTYEVVPPTRRIYAVEVAAEMAQRPTRAFVAALGLCVKGLWAKRQEPKYDGHVPRYAEAVFEALADLPEDELVQAGVQAWRAWFPTTGPQKEAVDEARSFTEAGGAPTSASAGTSS